MNWRAFTRLVVLCGIDAAAGDPTEQKQRILLARRCGFIDDRDAEDWIVLQNLESA